MRLYDFIESAIRSLFGGAPPASVPETAAGAPEAPPSGPRQPRQINRAGLDLIKAFEGLRLRAYQDSVGVWTIGYGHTRGVFPGQVITAAQAEELLRGDLALAEAEVDRDLAAAGWPYPGEITDNEFAALVSFVFNLGGTERHGAETPLRQLLSHGIDQVPSQLPRWDHAGGVELAGLKRRREAEAELWRTA